MGVYVIRKNPPDPDQHKVPVLLPVPPIDLDIDALPPKPKPEYTILDAIEEVSKGTTKTLMLQHRMTGEAYQVIAHDPQTGKTKLRGPHGAMLFPKITEREIPLYIPVWR